MSIGLHARLRGALVAVVAFCVVAGSGAPAQADGPFTVLPANVTPLAERRADGYAPTSWLTFSQVDSVCGGECAVTLSAGKFVETNMSEIFLYGDPVAPWDYEFAEDYIISLAGSRRVATLFDVIDLEAEVGVAQRFGLDSTVEVWVGGYARWTAFPWNDHVRTTIAINTGLNYATDVTALERKRGDTPDGSNLLHYLAPEITFAHPDWKRSEVVFRFHHRSGGEMLWGDSWLFDGVSGGAQYFTLGLRQRF